MRCSRVVWSSVVHVFWFYPGFVVYISSYQCYFVRFRICFSVVMILKSFYEFNAFSLNNKIKAGSLGYTNCYWPFAHEKVHDIFLALVILLSYPRWLGSNRLVAILRKGIRSIVHDGSVIIRCPKGVDWMIDIERIPVCYQNKIYVVVNFLSQVIFCFCFQLY